MSSRVRYAVVSLVAVAALSAGFFARSTMRQVPATHVRPNAMTESAGEVENGALVVRLEARDGEWYPEGVEKPVRQVAAFAEQDGPMQAPGPLIRLRSGREAVVHVRNALAKPLTVYGLGAQRGVAADSALLEPGEERVFRFRAGEPGVYYYAGRTEEVPYLFARAGSDSQLNGAIVIDPAEGEVAEDRLFMVTQFFDADTTMVSGLSRDAVLAINGRSWPHTDRLTLRQGDTVHWRWLNLTTLEHPMHLHGFYFHVDARGDGASHRQLAAADRPFVVTEMLTIGSTMDMTWSPVRAGNWVIHCHFASHVTSFASINTEPVHPEPAQAHGGHGAPAGSEADGDAVHAPHRMEGLVIGVHVRPRGRQAEEPDEARQLRLLVRSKANVYGEYAGFSFVLGGTPEEADPNRFVAPGPTLVLEKDQPVAITIINQSYQPAAVHWHGIELNSYADGVPEFSGSGRHLLPFVATGDSLTVRFTPPRAGTFMYHSHSNEFRQISGGLYGAIVVLERGQRYDPEHDRVLIFSDSGHTVNFFRGPFAPAQLNGRRTPDPMELRVGETYRLRLINIRTDATVAVKLLEGETPVAWKAVAADGADLPADKVELQAADLLFAPGQIRDFEFTPTTPGTLTLRFGTSPEIPEPGVDVRVNVRGGATLAAR